MRNSMVSPGSWSVSSVRVMATFLVLAESSGPNVTLLVAMVKSLPSAAVPVERTSTAKVVDAPGRWLTVMGTLSVAPLTASDTVAVYFAVDLALVPKATLAPARSSSVMVTVAVAGLPGRNVDPSGVERDTVNVSSSSTRSSDVVTTLELAAVALAAMATERLLKAV